MKQIIFSNMEYGNRKKQQSEKNLGRFVNDVVHDIQKEI